MFKRIENIISFYILLFSIVLVMCATILSPIIGGIVLIGAIVCHVLMWRDSKINVSLDAGAIMPTRAHDSDGGLDLYAPFSCIVSAKESTTFDTGVHIELPPNTVGFIKSRSGLNIKYDLSCEGVIDEGYTGSIKVKLYNLGGYDYSIKRGDRIAQLVIVPTFTPTPKKVARLRKTERADGGVGSTGR